MLVNGDHYTDSRGVPIALYGARELIQRALIRLSVKKGSFGPDPELGGELYKLHNHRGGSLERAALGYVQEALLPMPEIKVSSVTAQRGGADSISLSVALALGQDNYNLEVDVY